MTVSFPEPTAELNDKPIVNISCYKFVRFDNLEERRLAIRRRAVELNLKGTVLLSEEGINLFVAGPKDSIDSFVEFLRSDPALSDLQPKESVNEYQPFNRMLVKIKKEIIAFGIEGVEPGTRTSPKLPAAELKRWLDEGRKLHLLDTRNDYEVGIGTFENAINLHIDHFREFPDAVARLPEDMKDEPIVMFCTGGIRCEKAGPFMEMAGFRNVYQLDGGILKYFEEVGGDHWNGECFVFDQRVAVDPALRETGTTQCYICQAVVTPEQQQLPEYVPGKSCPTCFQSTDELRAQRLRNRERQIQQLTNPLPGSIPDLNRRPLNVPQRCAGLSLIDFLTTIHPQVSKEEWLQRIRASRIVPSTSTRRRRGRMHVPETLPLDENRIVNEGERFDQLEEHSVEPDVNAAVRFLFEDDEYIVIDKPAPLPVHASGRFDRNTLRYLLNALYAPQRPHIVHRLDANTSGVMLLCKRSRIATVIQKQFESRTVRKTYLARVIGQPELDQFECHASLGREPEQGGIRLIDPDGDEAHTKFTVLHRYPDGTTLLEVHPETGRTNQIRAHLWSLGFPICGDPAYLPAGQLGQNRTLSPSEPAMCLHAKRLELQDHLGQSRSFEAVAPGWASVTNQE
ncbi:MAG: sulfurtransferase [Planctomycetaceae bacterium]|nr:sulfurtransferase [Planctomycetaceae bacterium]